MDTDIEDSSLSHKKEKEVQDQVEYKVLGNWGDSTSMLLGLNNPETGPVHIDVFCKTKPWFLF